MTDYIDSLFDDPEEDPLEAENVRDGLGYFHDDCSPAEGTERDDEDRRYWANQRRKRGFI